MITFDIDSVDFLLPHLCGMVKRDNSQFFFNDGTEHLAVLDVEEHTSCFECNGQYSSAVTGYSLVLAGNTVKEFRLKGTRLVAVA